MFLLSEGLSQCQIEANTHALGKDLPHLNIEEAAASFSAC